MRRTRLSSGEWRALFRRQRASGLTVKAFCQRAGVALSTFSFWRRRLGDRPRVGERPHRVCFAEVTVSGEAGGVHGAGIDGVAESSGIELHLADGCRIAVQRGFDRQTLADVLAVLQAQRIRQAGAVRPCEVAAR
jgi:hypothetical protein